MPVQFGTTAGELTHKPWKNTKSSGIEESEAEHRACVVYNHNGRTDSQAMEKYEKSGVEASEAERRACVVCDHNGRTNSRAISNVNG